MRQALPDLCRRLEESGELWDYLERKAEEAAARVADLTRREGMTPEEALEKVVRRMVFEEESEEDLEFPET